jgi:hypothetical protein
MPDLSNGADPGAAAPAAPAPAPVPNGADRGAEKTYTVTDARSAGDAITGLLFADETAPAPAGKPSGEPPPSEEPPDSGADESRPTGPEDDKGPGEQPPPAAAIEPPTSWNAEEKQAFTQLPPALQQTVLRRESQREAVLTQRSQEAAEARRAYDGERQAAMALRTEYLAGLTKMVALAAPEAAALNNVDWFRLAQENPAEHVRLQAQRDNLKSRLGAIEQEFVQGQQLMSQYQQQQLAEVVAKEHQALAQKMPDFGDPAKGNPLRKELGTYLRDAGGFSDQEINTAYDHRLVVLATKAMLYDKQIANAASADTKRNNVAAPVRPPGTSQDNDRGPQTRLTRQVNRFARSNSVRDAGSLIAEILS